METLRIGAASTHSGITLPRRTRTPLRSLYRGPVVNKTRAGTRSYTTPLMTTVLPTPGGTPPPAGAVPGVTFTTRGPPVTAPAAVPTAPTVPATAPAAAPSGAPTTAPIGPATAAPCWAPAVAPAAAPETGLVA